MTLCPGDHVCSVYATRDELVRTATSFLAEGLKRGERCWYVPAARESNNIRDALVKRGVNVALHRRRSALRLVEANDAYVVRGRFDPEQTMRVFSDAIAQAEKDGFSGFRAAANMSWALRTSDGAEQLIAYEALLKSVFSSSHAIGLCLYDKRRMPLRILNGALLTHPLVGLPSEFHRNPRYDASVRSLAAVDESSSLLAQVTALNRSSQPASSDLGSATTSRRRVR